MFFFLLSSCLPAHAQERQIPIDSIKEIIESPPPQEVTLAETTEEKKPDYFLQKSQARQLTDSIQLRQLPDSLVKQLQKDDDFWYANAIFEKEKRKLQNRYVPLGQRNWFQTLLWLIIIGSFAGFLMWYLAGSNIGLFRKKKKMIDEEGKEEELATEDIFAINYQKEIDKAAQQGNYRLAVRLLFLRILKNLSQKNIIRYTQDKTNLDYLVQLHATRYYSDFFRITRNYEYSWYGLFEVNEDAYSVIKKEIDNFENQLK